MYDTPVKLARDHYTEIVDTFVEKIHQSSVVPYNTLPHDEAYKRYDPALENYLFYLETGDMTKWRDFCTYIVTLRVKQGLDYTAILDINDIMLACLSEFFTQTLPPLETVDGEAAAKVMDRLHNRLMGLRMVAKFTAIAAA